MKTPIFESYFEDRARSGNTDLCINLYPELVTGQKGLEPGILYSRNGLVLQCTLGSGPIRCLYAANNGLMYVVSGNGFYSVTSSYQSTLLGTIGSGVTPCYIVENPTQVSVVDGTGAWVLVKASNSFTQTIPNNNTGASSPSVIVYQDGFGIVSSLNSNQIYQSNYNDLSMFATPVGGGGSTPNNAFVQNNSQNIVTMYDLEDQVWIFKQKQIEVWGNVGSSGFAFSPIQGISIPFGCCAPNSVARLGNDLVWLGSDEQGDSVVYRSSGYQAKPISTNNITAPIQGFSVISDAQAYSFQRNQHYYYVITFPTQNISFCYDATTAKWHQRSYWSNYQFNRELPNCHTLFNGDNIVGDYRNGNIYAMSDNVFTDNGNQIKWLRQWNAVNFGDKGPIPISFDSLQLFMETGISQLSGTNPQIMLRWSDDGGYTWTDYFQMSVGKIGQTSWRVLQNRLGSTKIGTGLERVFEISGIDPINIKIYDATIEGGPS